MSKLEQDQNQDKDLKLKNLLILLQDQQNQLKQKNQGIDQIRKNGLLKIPLTVLFSNVLVFLDDLQLLTFASVNQSIYKIIYSPIGYKLLFYTRNSRNYKTATQLQKAEPPSYEILDLNSINQTQQNFSEGEDLEASFMALKSVKDFITLKLKQSQEYIIKLKQDQQDILQELQIEKQKNEKQSNQLRLYSQKNVDYNEELEQIHQKYQIIIQQSEENNKNLKEQNEKLLQQRQQLALQIKKYKDDIAKMNSHITKYKDTLANINYFFEALQ